MEREMEEANHLLAEAEMARLRGMTKRRDVAAQALFKQLVSLDGVNGLRVRQDRSEWNVVEVGLNFKAAGIRYYTEHGIRILGGKDDPQVEVVLDLDPATDTFVGCESDRFRTPVPGDVPRRRPAIAVLVEALLKKLQPAA